MKKKFINRCTFSLLIISTFAVFTGCTSNTKFIKENKINTDLSAYELENYKNNLTESRIKKLYKDEDAVVGFLVKTLKEPIWKKHYSSFIGKAEELGSNILFEQANNDTNTQIAQIDELIAKGVDVLVIGAVDGESVKDSVKKAKDNGIKVIAYDQIIPDADIDLFISLDSYEVGKMQGQYIVDNIEEGKIIYLGGDKSDNNALIFRDEALNIVHTNQNIKVVFDEFTPVWSSETAYDNVKKVLQDDKEIKAILAANDSTASGAITALKEYSLDKKVIVTGLDAELSACQKIVDGTQSMTVYKPADKMAEKAAECAIALARGEKVETNSTVFNGKIDVPTYYILPQVITKDNMMDTIIKDNYYTENDVYKK